MKLQEPWRNHPKARAGHVDEVSVLWLKQFKGNKQRLSGEEMEKLKKSILKEGLMEPITLIVGLKTQLVYIGEGNHRLEIFYELGIKKIPTTV